MTIPLESFRFISAVACQQCCVSPFTARRFADLRYNFFLIFEFWQFHIRVKWFKTVRSLQQRGSDLEGYKQVERWAEWTFSEKVSVSQAWDS